MPRPTPELQRAYQKEWYERRRETRLKLALDRLGGKCVVCGSSDNLQFYHIERGTRAFKITSGVSWNLQDFLTEVDKCQLLCIIHHNEKTCREVGHIPTNTMEGRIHGIAQTYKLGCKCSECRRANADRTYLNKLGLPST